MIKKVYQIIRQQLSEEKLNNLSDSIFLKKQKHVEAMEAKQSVDKVNVNKLKKKKGNDKALLRLPDQYPSLLQELEPRFMFDGAAIETVDLADGVSEQEQIYILNAIDQNEQAHATESLLQAIEANVEGFQTDYSKFKEVVIVDARVKDPHILIDSISRKAAIEVILPDQDGVDKIAELLAKYNNLDAVHIISHGDQAKLELGSVDLTSNNLAQYQMQLQQWGQALTEQGDILFYGCNVAEGDKGQAFIDELKALTSADIAASIDITGSINRGGDFILEANEAVDVDAIIFDNLTYEHLLGDADGTLNALNVNSQPLIDLLINPHDILVQDPSGTNIYDGGEDMYDTGNILNTNLQSSISYTNGVVTNGDSSFGAGSKYFTKEYAPGYFVAVATGINITQFSITGGTGADLAGTITGGEFVAANSNYKVYYTLTGNASDPSINHLVIIKNNGGSSHSFSSSTDPENHIIQVGTSDELYFIVAAQKNGLTLTTTQLQDIQQFPLSMKKLANKGF